MADFTFNPSAARRHDSTSYDGGELALELTALPKSRAPSYVSTSKNSFVGFGGGGDDDDEEFLLRHPRSISGAESLRKEALVVTRVDSSASTLGASREKRRKLQGWRFGVACSAWIAFTALVTNTIVAIVVATKFDVRDGLGVAYRGSCETVDSWATWLHIAINIVSSTLLSASNYTMQCLCSPTRKEIDRAHAKGDWLDIGVASLRNILGRISWRRTILWWILGLSSVPIHLLYNSVVFKTLESNVYRVANENFLNGDPFFTQYASYRHNNSVPTGLSHSPSDVSDISLIQGIQRFFAQNYRSQDTSVIQNLTNEECLTNYGTSFVTSRSDVILVTGKQGVSVNHSVFLLISGGQPSGYLNKREGYYSAMPWAWICNDYNIGWNSEQWTQTSYCTVAQLKNHAAEWTMNDAKIEYCLSRIRPEHCKLQFSLQILVAVIVCNVLKSGAMFWTLFKQKEATLVTTGDAVASFLNRPDELTRGRCLMAKVDVPRGPLRWRLRGLEKPFTHPEPVTFHAPLRRRWFTAVSAKRWCVTIGLCIAGLTVSGSLLGLAVASLDGLSDTSPFSLGFGSLDANAMIETMLPSQGASGLISSVLLANCPQAICSFLYLAYNGLFTAMLHASEWSQYFLRPKALRVTTPHGKQRSTYYLQLPYIYSLPLLAASATLHWLISESIFLARINYWSDDVPLISDDSSQVGFSCAPILCVIVLGTTMLVVALANGCRKFSSLIPVVGSCSVAIAAACHAPKDDVDAAFLPVSWGEVHCEGTPEVGHCCFTSEDTQDLIPGRMYAGSGAEDAHQDDEGRRSIRKRRLHEP